MITSANSEFQFALESQRVRFMPESTDRMVAILALPSGRKVPVSLRCPAQQHQLEAHLPHTLKGDAAWIAYEKLADLSHFDAFKLWIDPTDGETKYCTALREATAYELDAALARAATCLDVCWELLTECEQAATSPDELDFSFDDFDDDDEPSSTLGKLLSGALFGRS